MTDKLLSTPTFLDLRKILNRNIELVPEQRLSEAQFKVFCQHNPELRVELTSQGNLYIMPPVHFDSSSFEAEVIAELTFYVRNTGQGRAVSSSGGFKLPDGSVRMPDAAWISEEKYDQLSRSARKSFPAVVPDFVVEIRAHSDSLAKLKDKMVNCWIGNGVRLAWLIDPKEQKAYIYRANGSIEVVANFEGTLNGEDVVPGFEFALNRLT
jgi:Uma2 family endonuclease